MIEIPDLAIVAAGTMTVFYIGNELLRSRRQRARQRAEIESLETQLDAARRRTEHLSRSCTAEVLHLAHDRIPAAATRAAHPHVQVPGPLDPTLTDSELGAALHSALTGVATATLQERKRVDAAARAGMRGATREIQAGLYRLQDVLRGLQQRYDDPELSQTLYSLDHENEQSLRRAQVAAVVCGAWVGLAREESHLVDAVTGGQSRIIGYQRVHMSNHLEPGTALVSHAVEPVAIIVAELLDNALRHSSPDTTVTVNLERAHHGVTVTVDDAGVGMAADERAYAQRMVAGRDPILLSELGDPPRMGLAAIGQLTRQFDLSVDLSSPSPYGGVRAVLLVKNHLLSHIDPAERPQAASAPHSTRGGATAEPGHGLPAAGPLGLPGPAGPGGLPGNAGHPGAPETPAPAGPAQDRGRQPGPAQDRPEPYGADRLRTEQPDRPRTEQPGAGPDRPEQSWAEPSWPGRPAWHEPRTPATAPGVEWPAPAPAPSDLSPSAPSAPSIPSFASSPTRTAADPGAAPSPAPSRTASEAITHDPAPAPGDDLLPRRRRRVRAAGHPGEAPPRPPRPARSPEEAAAALGALQAGTAAARNAADPEGNDPR
ncbi:ATP-binding protein [Streptomyces sp. NPDC020141]|uniref:ATP-binding protein n=1 Tax=Streptomyces sp. NPDC020141 TaxID=3365065 RepID=UPI0037BDB883